MCDHNHVWQPCVTTTYHYWLIEQHIRRRWLAQLLDGTTWRHVSNRLKVIYRTNNISRRKNIVFGGCGNSHPLKYINSWGGADWCGLHLNNYFWVFDGSWVGKSPREPLWGMSRQGWPASASPPQPPSSSSEDSEEGSEEEGSDAEGSEEEGSDAEGRGSEWGGGQWRGAPGGNEERDGEADGDDTWVKKD